ncbi:MAG: TIR domain-containing protein [Oscillospiraceae bacterium]|nr:TIR domain-containing protein [Oscillospiraceae bacterium]
MYTKQKHNVFISFYHADDQKYKNYIDKFLSKNIINKSVVAGEYNPDNSDEYIKRLIREEKITSSSVIVVLVGQNTKKRKHVDWEIYAGLDENINGNSGLIAVMLPSINKTPNGGYYYRDMPQRLADNVRTGYASIYDWEYAVRNFDKIIEIAFENRIVKKALLDNSRKQMRRNL